MRKFLQVIVLVCLLVFTAFVTRADELDDITKQLASLNAEVSNKESDKANVIKQINGIRARVTTISNEVVKKEKEVAEGEKNLVHQKKLLDERARSYYKNINKSGSAFIGLLIGENFSDSLQNFFYQKVVVDEDRNAIVKIVLYIKNLEDTKQELVEERKQLAEINSQLDKQTALLEGEIASTRGKIAQLSARQQELVSAKLSSIPVPRSADTTLAGCQSDIDVNPGFDNRFAFFSFGVPNKTGLNQYGAYGRSKEGKSYEDILRAYYNYDNLKDYSTDTKIKVDGHGEYSLEDYAKRIYEMPEDWGNKGGFEALKAQAVAARSYALAYTNNGAGSICDSQNCQVFRDQEKGGKWSEAVDATRGKVMVQGDQPIKAWFSSTHGGVILTSAEIGWSGTSWTKHGIDTPSGSAGSASELMQGGYDKDSPWFYCDWGYRKEYNNTAWLRASEVADIANAFMLYDKDKSTITHLSQTDKESSDTWSADKVKDELRARGGSPLDSVGSVSVAWDGSGISKSITIEGRSFDAQKFKNLFNVRAPSNIQIKPACNPDANLGCSPSALFNVEKR